MIPERGLPAAEAGRVVAFRGRRDGTEGGRGDSSRRPSLRVRRWLYRLLETLRLWLLDDPRVARELRLRLSAMYGLPPEASLRQIAEAKARLELTWALAAARYAKLMLSLGLPEDTRPETALASMTRTCTACTWCSSAPPAPASDSPAR